MVLRIKLFADINFFFLCSLFWMLVNGWGNIPYLISLYLILPYEIGELIFREYLSYIKLYSHISYYDSEYVMIPSFRIAATWLLSQYKICLELGLTRHRKQQYNVYTNVNAKRNGNCHYILLGNFFEVDNDKTLNQWMNC